MCATNKQDPIINKLLCYLNTIDDGNKNAGIMRFGRSTDLNGSHEHIDSILFDRLMFLKSLNKPSHNDSIHNL